MTVMPNVEVEDLCQCVALADVLVKNMADGVIAFNADGKVILINEAATKITRLSQQEAVGKGIEEIFSYPGPKEKNPLLISLSSGEVRLDHGFSLITSTGERLPLSVTCTPILNKNGKVLGGVAVFRDVTELREIEDMKTEFVSTVSHELRTPLTSIKGSIGLILGGVAGEVHDEIAELLTIAQNNTDRLIKLINEMLDVSKIESGKIQMNKESVSLDTLVKKALEGIKSYANECQVKLKCQIPEYMPLVLADRDRIDQVITNLLSNAIKFTPAGGVVSLEVDDEPGFVTISVADTGIGIPHGQLEKIFDKFHQVDQSSIRQRGGTGLGLSICYAIVSEHGGKIWAESTEGEGSAFYFSLPKLAGLVRVRGEEEQTSMLARLEQFQERVRHRQETRVEGKTVLICDDDPTAVRELKSYLEKEGFDCIEAYSGREAVEIAKRTKVDAITLDIIMPGLDGFQVVNLLKGDPATDSIPIVFVSVLKDKANKEISLGVQDWLVKPVDEARVLRSINSAIGQKKERPVVLAVDDDRDTVKLLTTMIERAGYAAETAYDGQEAIDKINTFKPDLIILDIMMPGLDGFQVVSLLREKNWTNRIPVLVLTAKELNPLEKKLLHLGMTKFLTKSYATHGKIMRSVAELLYTALGR